MGTLSLGASIQSSCTGWIVSVGLYSQSGLTGDLGLDGSTMAVGLTTGAVWVVASSLAANAITEPRGVCARMSAEYASSPWHCR